MTLQDQQKKAREAFNEEFCNQTDEDVYVDEKANFIRRFLDSQIKEAYEAGREKESNAKCEEHRKHPCYKCLDVKYGKWRSPVDKDDPAWQHSRLDGIITSQKE